MARARLHDRSKVAILISLATSLSCIELDARWMEQADELPEWAQRGRMIFLRWDEVAPLLPEFDQWKPVLHLHGARCSGRLIAECDTKQIPLSLRLESVMFFGDDRAVKKIKERAYHGWPEHSWYWQYNWWIRDPIFHAAALIRRDGEQMNEYPDNPITEREMGNPLHPTLWRMRREISQAVLTPHDPQSPSNLLYPKFPYTPYDDTHFGLKGEPYEYYPVFGHLSMLWYDNPNLWADASEFSQERWRAFFKEHVGVETADPAGHSQDEVRRAWTRFWADAYGDYLDDYYKTHQANVMKSVVASTTTGLNGKRHLCVGINASAVAKPWGAELLYLFHEHRITSFPGPLVEYEAPFTRGKHAPMIKFSMAAMRGRQTGWSATDPTAEAEALALNGTHAYTELTPRAKAYIRFQFDNRVLLTNAMQGNRIGIVYNVRSGLTSNALIGAYDLGEQLDELGIPYDVIVEEDLTAANKNFLHAYAALLVAGGEFNYQELEGLKEYMASGGLLILVGDVADDRGRLMGGEFRSKGHATICNEQIVTNRRLEEILKPRLAHSYRIRNSQGGLVCANALRQPRQGETRIIGLINYSGQPQKNIELALPEDNNFKSAAAISPDGYAELLEIKSSNGQPTVILPDLYNYTALVLGEAPVLEAALATVKPRAAELIAARVPLKKAVATPLSPAFTMNDSMLKPETVPDGQQLSRLRHGTFETASYIVMDALAPKQAKAGKPFRITMNLHYTKNGTLEYWRVHAVNSATNKEIQNQPPGAKEAIDGVGVQQVEGEKLVPMGFESGDLIGKILAAELKLDQPGTYWVYLDYLFNSPFAHGDPGPRIEPAFLGARPQAGWGYPARPLKKHYLKYRFPGMTIEVRN